MSWKFGPASEKRLVGVDARLVAVVRRALEISKVDFLVIEGVRSREQMAINWGKGRTVAQVQAVGLDPKYAQPKAGKVTWLKNPYNSKHGIQKNGFGHAVDLGPAPLNWNDLAGFREIGRAMTQASQELGIPTTWGATFSSPDLPHHELRL